MSYFCRRREGYGRQGILQLQCQIGCVELFSELNCCSKLSYRSPESVSQDWGKGQYYCHRPHRLSSWSTITCWDFCFLLLFSDACCSLGLCWLLEIYFPCALCTRGAQTWIEISWVKKPKTLSIVCLFCFNRCGGWFERLLPPSDWPELGLQQLGSVE